MTDTRIDDGELQGLRDNEDIVVMSSRAVAAPIPTIDLRSISKVASPAIDLVETLFERYEALSFSDVLVVPRDSDIEPADVDLCTTYTAALSLQVPFVVSSPSFNVASAVAVARAGGIAVLPGHSGIAAQAFAVRRVKDAHRGWIQEPVSLSHRSTVGQARELWARHEISGAPVVDDLDRLIGMLTKRDVRFCTTADASRSVRDLMTKEPELVTAPVGMSLRQARELMRWNRYEKLPMVDENGRLVALVTVRDLLSAEAHPLASTDPTGRLKCAASVAVGPDVLDRVDALVESGVDAVVVGRPDGSFAGVTATVSQIRNRWSSLSIVAGRANTAEGIRWLHDAGANAVNIGGSGRNGATVPLLSLLNEMALTADDLGVPLIARGACGSPGDLLKAFVSGSSAVELDPASLALPASSAAPSVDALLRQMANGLRSAMAAVGALDLQALRSAEMKRVSRPD